jgi:hypothetical protein
MINAINTLLTRVFFDNFYLSAAITIGLVIILALKRWSNFFIPGVLAVSVWWFLVLSAGAVAALLTVQFFSYPKGIDRLAILAVFSCATPLFVAAALAIFVFRVR